MLQSTASILNCTGGGNGDNPTNISRVDVENVVQSLMTANADYITDQIDAEDRFGTSPINDAYFAMGSTRLLPNLRQVDGWVDKNAYGTPGKYMPSEVGAVSNMRVVLSSGGSVDSGASILGADVYDLFVTGQQSYVTVDQNGFTAKFMYVPPMPSSADPAGLRQYSSARFAFASVISNDAWVINLRSTLS
jgi:N4-gp56 family major capsid protein